MRPLFVYGTLYDEAIQRELFGRVIRGEADTLVGFRLDEVVIEGETYKVAVPADGASVDGFRIELTDDDLAKADAYETEAYTRVKLTLKSGREAWVYLRREDKR